MKKRLLYILAGLFVMLPAVGFGQVTITSIAATKEPGRDTREVVAIMTATPRADVIMIVVIDAVSGERLNNIDVVYIAAETAGKVEGFRIPALPLKPGGSYVVLVTTI